MNLSKVYEDGKVWSISYDTGHGDRELINKIFVSSNAALEWLVLQPEDYFIDARITSLIAQE